jgi:hypothetical protein
MITKTKTGIALMALVFGIALSPMLSNEALAKTFPPLVVLQGELTAPNQDQPFGGEVVGAYTIGVYDTGMRGGLTTISVQIDSKATPGTVYEGWLVDTDSGEKTSFGRFQENTQRQEQFHTVSVVSNFNNDLIVITEEPIVDTDPAPDTPIAGAVLENPYGQ